MPEYLAPGVFVEETTFRSKSIEGVSTSTAAFVGLTARGPLTNLKGNAPPMLTRFADYERIYGGFEDLRFGTKAAVNHMAHAVRVFFDNGGGRLYVARVIGEGAKEAESKELGLLLRTTATAEANKQIFFKGKTPGGAVMPGTADVNMMVTVRVVLQAATPRSVRQLPSGSIVRLTDAERKKTWFLREPGNLKKLSGNGVMPEEADALPAGSSLAVALMSVVVEDASQQIYEYAGLGLRIEHPRAAHGLLGGEPPRLADKLANPVRIEIGSDADALEKFAIDLLETLEKPLTDAGKALKAVEAELTALNAGPAPATPEAIAARQKEIEAKQRLVDQARATVASTKSNLESDERTIGAALSVPLTKGSDGTAPPSIESYKDALAKLGALEDISIIASPGGWSIPDAPATHGEAVNLALIAAAEKARAYRIAVLDPPPDQEPNQVRELKAKIDSKYAALYYPWVMTPNPLFGIVENQPAEVGLPPSGFVCGVYARTDVERGVWKAPANETVRMATRLQRDVSFGEQEVLNPLGINCIRLLPNRGFRIWGARTTSSDPEWKYVNIRRYFLYLEASIDRSMQWAVFEPNGERLWANVRQTVADFLYNEWINGALLGATPKEAFFVRCDRSTITQNDLDNGRLICLIGVAAVKPAEFVIFRIGQKTVDAKA